MPQISVIVPVYKVEPYLRRCVDSILGQTFTDFELILVDDGSPDNCPAICDEYARKDTRVHVIHQENGGLSAARNAGIDWAFANSDSQWLTSVDSDDWVHPEMLERLLNAALDHHVAVSICGYAETKGEELEINADQLTPQIWIPEDFFVERNVNATVAWGKLYQKDCFQGIRYPAGKLHEDEFTTYKILFAHPKIAVISAPLYCYYHNPNSITTSDWTPRRMEVMQAFDEQLSFFAKSGFPIALKRRVRSYFWMLCAQYYGARSAPQLYHHEIKQIKNQMRKIMWKYDKLIDPTWHEYVTAYEIAYPHLNKIRNVFRGKLRIL